MTYPPGPPVPGSGPSQPFGGSPYGPPPGGPTYGQPPVGGSPYGPPPGGPAYGAPAYGQPPGAPFVPGGDAQIALETAFFPLFWVLYFIMPRVKIDGNRLDLKWGQQLIPVSAGQHLIEINAWWLFDFSKASFPVQVASGQTVPVFYKCSAFWPFFDGAIGHEPQKFPGLPLYIGFLVASFVLPMLCCCGLVFTGAFSH